MRGDSAMAVMAFELLYRPSPAATHARVTDPRQATLEAEARQLGMIKPGEQPFIATGLPDN